MLYIWEKNKSQYLPDKHNKILEVCASYILQIICLINKSEPTLRSNFVGDWTWELYFEVLLLLKKL